MNRGVFGENLSLCINPAMEFVWEIHNCTPVHCVLGMGEKEQKIKLKDVFYTSRIYKS